MFEISPSLSQDQKLIITCEGLKIANLCLVKKGHLLAHNLFHGQILSVYYIYIVLDCILTNMKQQFSSLTGLSVLASLRHHIGIN